MSSGKDKGGNGNGGNGNGGNGNGGNGNGGNGNGGNGNGGNSSVKVVVNYQKETKEKIFPRGDKISDVLIWAINEFKIDDAIATELELVVEGTKDELAGSATIASLVHGGSSLALDLVRGDIANGAI